MVQINLDKKKYKELLVLLGLGSWVREKVFEADKKPLAAMDETLDAVLEAAKGTDAAEHVREKDGFLDHSAWVEKEVGLVMDRFIDDGFWHELAVRLAQRDFMEDMTEEEEALLNKVGGRFDRRIDGLFERYQDELDEHGVERLRVDE
jgi:hypothetical protein